MINTIGETAGKVYQALESNGSLSISQLKKHVGSDPFTLHAAIGWLARENKVSFQKKGRSVIVTLV